MKSTLRVVGGLALVLTLLLALSAMTVSAQQPTPTPTGTAVPGAVATPAQAPPPAAAGANLDDPGVAAAIGSAAPAIPANTAQWFRFDYETPVNEFPRNLVTIRLVNGVTNGLGFEVWSPERMQGNWFDNEPVGRGTQEVLANCEVTLPDDTVDKCRTNDLTWVGGFGVSAPYHVRVINDTDNALAPLLIFSGSGLAQCATGQAPAQPAAPGTNQGFTQVVCDPLALPTVVAQAQAAAAGVAPAGPAAAPTIAATPTPAAAAATPAASPTTAATSTPAAAATVEASPTTAAPSTPAAAAPAAATTAAGAATAVATQAAGAGTAVATSAAGAGTAVATSAAGAGTAVATSAAGAATAVATQAATAAATGTPAAAPTSPTSAGAAAMLTGIDVNVNATLGPILTDSQGRTLYLFTQDTSSTSTCTGTCAQTWPPALVSGTPQAGTGITAAMMGTTSRSDGGTQVTYNGHPLYYFSGDTSTGDTNGQGVGGNWFVISPDGTANQAGGAGGAMTPGAAGTPAGTATP